MRRSELNRLMNMTADDVRSDGVLANSWSDAAREASKRVRQAKAAMRAASRPATPPAGKTKSKAGFAPSNNLWKPDPGVDDPLYIFGAQKPALAIPKPVPVRKPAPKKPAREPAEKYPWHILGGGLVNRRTDGARAVSLADRVAERAAGLLANIGWTDEARYAAALARQRNAAARAPDPVSRTAGGSAKVPASGLPPGALPPRGMPPASDGDLVTNGSGVYVMSGGKLCRLGSSKILKVLADGSISVKAGRANIRIPNPKTWATRPDGGGLMMYGTKIYYEGGGWRIDLETGGVAKVDGRKTPGGGREKLRF